MDKVWWVVLVYLTSQGIAGKHLHVVILFQLRFGNRYDSGASGSSTRATKQHFTQNSVSLGPEEYLYLLALEASPSSAGWTHDIFLGQAAVSFSILISALAALALASTRLAELDVPLSPEQMRLHLYPDFLLDFGIVADLLKP